MSEQAKVTSDEKIVQKNVKAMQEVQDEVQKEFDAYGKEFGIEVPDLSKEENDDLRRIEDPLSRWIGLRVAALASKNGFAKTDYVQVKGDEIDIGAVSDKQAKTLNHFGTIANRYLATGDQVWFERTNPKK